MMGLLQLAIVVAPMRRWCVSVVPVLALVLLVRQPSFGSGKEIHDVGVTVTGEDYLPIVTLQQFARVDGSHARTILDVVFRTDVDHEDGAGRMEGTFHLELPTGASPYVLAFGPEIDGPPELPTPARRDGSVPIAEDFDDGHFLSYSPDENLTVASMMSKRQRSVSPNLKPARMAGRSVASRSFTETVNRRVDPAILERGSGAAGSFSTRLFPLFRDTLYRVTFGYDLPLTFVGTGSSTKVSFELNLPAPIGSPGADYNGGGGGGGGGGSLATHSITEVISTIQPETPQTEVVSYFSEGEQEVVAYRYRATFRTNNADAHPKTRSHRMKFPSHSLEQGAFLDFHVMPPSWGQVEGLHHFSATILADDASTTAMTERRSSPSQPHAVFAVETSFAVAQREGTMDRFVEILQAVLEADPNIIKFNILLFDIGIQWWSSSSSSSPSSSSSSTSTDNSTSTSDGWLLNDESGRSVATDFLRGASLEGATNLYLAISELLNPTMVKPQDQMPQQQQPYDVFLLSSGAVTWGETDANRIVSLLASAKKNARDTGFALLLPVQRLHSYHVGSTGGDPLLLERLANAAGGVFTGNLDEDRTLVPSAASLTRHLSPAWVVESISVDGTDDVVIFGGNPDVIRPGQTLQIAWRSKYVDSRTVRIKWATSANNNNNSTDSTTDIKMSSLPPIPMDIGVRAYGVIANSVLEGQLPLLEQQCRALALFYRVVGRTASLVMLESERDYERYKIPAFYPFETIRDIGSVQGLLDDEQKMASQSPRAALLDFILKIQKGGVRLVFPYHVWAFIEEMSDTSLDIASALLASSHYDRLSTTILSSLLKEELSEGPVASYDAWSAEAAARRGQGDVDENGKDSFGALRALTSLLAQHPADYVLRRDVALSAVELGFPAAAYFAFRHVAADVRPWEPMSYIQMARTAQAAGFPSLAVAMYEIAIGGVWQPRFQAFKEVSGMLYARQLRQILEGGSNKDETTPSLSDRLTTFASRRESQVRSRYSAVQKAGLVVVMTWNQDQSDLDLVTTEPNGDECSFRHRVTKSGGELYSDVKEGYGPEMYVQRNLDVRGKYKIVVEVFEAITNRYSAPIKVLVEVFTDWGFSTEQYQAHTAVGRRNKQRIHVTTVNLHDHSEFVEVPIGVIADDGAKPVELSIISELLDLRDLRDDETGQNDEAGRDSGASERPSPESYASGGRRMLLGGNGGGSTTSSSIFSFHVVIATITTICLFASSSSSSSSSFWGFRRNVF